MRLISGSTSSSCTTRVGNPSQTPLRRWPSRRCQFCEHHANVGVFTRASNIDSIQRSCARQRNSADMSGQLSRREDGQQQPCCYEHCRPTERSGLCNRLFSYSKKCYYSSNFGAGDLFSRVEVSMLC